MAGGILNGGLSRNTAAQHGQVGASDLQQYRRQALLSPSLRANAAIARVIVFVSFSDYGFSGPLTEAYKA
eukprot:scaffold70975_cov17-Tisochrysis_lutea.AAC.1